MAKTRISKASLREYVTKKIDVKVKEARQAIDKAIDEHMSLFVKNLDLGKVVGLAGLLSDEWESKLSKSGYGWVEKEYYQLTNDFAAVSNMHFIERRIVNNLADKMRSYILNLLQYTRYTDEFIVFCDQFKKSNSELFTKFEKLKLLRSELSIVIDAERDGNKAYKALVALGVDLSDFEPAKQNLPAVIKLSVDPCLINGTCN